LAGVSLSGSHSFPHRVNNESTKPAAAIVTGSRFAGTAVASEAPSILKRCRSRFRIFK
jgi:hypothetical protein